METELLDAISQLNLTNTLIADSTTCGTVFISLNKENKYDIIGHTFLFKRTVHKVTDIIEFVGEHGLLTLL